MAVRLQLALATLCLTCTVILQVGGQVAEKFTAQNPCVSKTTCHECIQTPSCAWCYQHMNQYGDRPRCFQLASPSPLGGHCPEQFTFFPGNSLTTILKKSLSKAGGVAGGAAGGSGAYGGGYAGGSGSGGAAGSSGSYGGFQQEEIVQVSPQRVSLKLRARESYSFSMYYTQAEDYPVDLYYLMDLSKSMEDDKDKLSSLGNLLADSMRNITSNFRLGFGSFVDKVVMPYVSTVPRNLMEPCKGCAAPYGFHNVMKLSTDTHQFSHMVKAASVSGNLDAPEGGFDAIMQAVVCKDEIGWRDQARRLLVFSTDAGFHYAGDGKLGGIIKPNDGYCHLDYSGMYTHSPLQDYPSISQINLKVKQNVINVIFAVTEEQISVYEKLQAHIEGASSGKLSADSSNVVELVKQQYEAISSTIEMKDNATGAVKIKYYTKCLNASAPENATNRCEDIKVGNLIEFRLEVLLTECPKDPSKWKQTIQVYPIGLNESLIIDLEMLCSCPCEHPGDPGYIEFAPECNSFGTYKCGVCDCDRLHFGRLCECSASGVQQQVNDTKGCREPGSNSTLDCSGRGSCVCNRCECDVRGNEEERIYGHWCECDNFSCYRHEGKICGGHGTCECGSCNCTAPWTGPACDCYNVTETCYAPYAQNGEMCSGHGECVCGVCQCHSTDEGRYSGRYCDRCPGCSDRCDEFKACVQCQMYGTGPIESKEECLRVCTKFTPESVKVVQVKEENDENLCADYDEEDCRYAFVYYFDKDYKVHVRAQEERECPPKVFLLGIVLGVIAAIVLMGLAILLLWKLLTTIHDRREFAKFEKERMMAKWDTGENPIYKQATSTFKNPTYAGKG